MVSKQFPISSLINVFIFTKTDRNLDPDIVQFLTGGSRSENDLDDRMHRKYIQDLLLKQFPKIAELLSEQKIGQGALEQFTTDLTKEYGEYITVNS